MGSAGVLGLLADCLQRQAAPLTGDALRRYIVSRPGLEAARRERAARRGAQEYAGGGAGRRGEAPAAEEERGANMGHDVVDGMGDGQLGESIGEDRRKDGGKEELEDGAGGVGGEGAAGGDGADDGMLAGGGRIGSDGIAGEEGAREGGEGLVAKDMEAGDEAEELYRLVLEVRACRQAWAHACVALFRWQVCSAPRSFMKDIGL